MHLCSIDCNIASKKLPNGWLPETGFISVFTTYSETDYFLEYITELEDIKLGYTHVSVVGKPVTIKSENPCMDRLNVSLISSELQDGSYPMFSFLSNVMPDTGVDLSEILQDYFFICQFYSADFPMPYKDVLGLTDAIGYLFLRRSGSKEKLNGLFIVSCG